MGKIDFIGLSGMGESSIGLGVIIAMVCFILLSNLTLFVLRGVGLFTLAKKQKIKGKGLAFVPFLWVYVMAKLIGKKVFKGFPLLVTLASILSGALGLVATFLTYFPIVGYYFSGGEVVISLAEGAFMDSGFTKRLSIEGVCDIYVRNTIVSPYPNDALVFSIIRVFSIIADLLGVAYSFATIFIYIFLFRRYWPREFILGTILSVLVPEAFAIIIFCLRKKDPMTREEYLRSMGARNPNVYYYNPGANNPNGTTYKKPEDTNPFKDFEDKNKPTEDPFSEFDKKD